jgi:hypothetical protein
MSEFADSSQVILAHVAETSLGTTPATPTLLKARFTSETLAHAIENTQSEEIRADGGVGDLIQVGGGVSGDISFEWSYDANLQALLADALRGSWTSNTLKRGILKPSRTFEKKFETGATDQYFRYLGCRLGGLNGTIQAQQKLTGSAPVVGLSAVRATTAISGSTYTEPSTANVMAAPDIANITLDGVTGTVYLTELSWTMTHNLRQQNAAGSLGAVGVGYGQTVITGKLVGYLDAATASLYDLAIAGTQSEIAFDIADASGNTYGISFPKVKYNKPTVNAQGNNQDVFVNVEFQALVDATAQTDMIITRTPASP